MNGAAALKDIQRAAADRFAASGVPHRRIEAWHYSDLRAVLPDVLHAPAIWEGAAPDRQGITILNGRCHAKAEAGPDGIEIINLNDAVPIWVAQHAKTIVATPMADLALAHMTSGLAIRVPKNVSATLDLSFINRSAAGEARHIRIDVIVEAGAHLTLVEHHSGEGGGALTNLAMAFSLDAHASVTHLKTADDPLTDIHVATVTTHLEAGSHYNAACIAAGGRFLRQETHCTLAAPDARFTITGLMLNAGQQHSDMTAFVDHVGRSGVSDLVFKSVLDGRARSVANGRVIVEPGALKTDSRQQSRALLLSKTAEANCKPELEIYADDVACAHGTAIGDLDDDALFYLRSRGIPSDEARALLTEAFLEEALARLPEMPASEAMHAFVLARLRTLGAVP